MPLKDLASCLNDDGLSFEAKLQQTCVVIANAVKGNIRSNIWVFDDAMNEIECIASYCAITGKENMRGFKLSKVDFPQYFEAILTQESIVVQNARFDERTACLGSYFEQHDVYSLLDLVFKYQSKPFGVICCEGFEHTKAWSPSEIESVRNITKILSSFLPTALIGKNIN